MPNMGPPAWALIWTLCGSLIGDPHKSLRNTFSAFRQVVLSKSPTPIISTPFDLVLNMPQPLTPQQPIELQLVYSNDLFQESTIRHMTGVFEVLCGSLLAEPAVPIKQACMLSPEEREQVNTGWTCCRGIAVGALDWLRSRSMVFKCVRAAKL